MINKYLIFGILATVRRYTPAKPPIKYETINEKMAYYAGWHECAKNFEDSVVELIEREAGK